jgi:hypothetical protein
MPIARKNWSQSDCIKFFQNKMKNSKLVQDFQKSDGLYKMSPGLITLLLQKVFTSSEHLHFLDEENMFCLESELENVGDKVHEAQAKGEVYSIPEVSLTELSQKNLLHYHKNLGEIIENTDH